MYNNLYASLTVTRCVFQDNSATSYGGGMCNDNAAPDVTGCTFLGNSAGDGGGMYNETSSGPEVIQCLFKGNSADHDGGGVCTIACYIEVTQCTFYENSAGDNGGGVYSNYCSPWLPEFFNCILWNNTPDALDGEQFITYSCIQGGYTGAGNIDLDPLFVDPAQDDLHLRYTSPCKDTGDSEASGLPSDDFEGDPRDAYGVVDMGADEFYTHLYVIGDVTPGGDIQGKFVGLPGSSPVGLFIGSSMMPTPIPPASRLRGAYPHLSCSFVSW